MVIATMQEDMQVWCSNIRLIHAQHQLNFVERENVTAFGQCRFPNLFCDEQRSKGPNEV
jgi:hypothetical protein